MGFKIRTWKFVPVVFLAHLAIQLFIIRYVTSQLENINEIPIPNSLENAQKIAQMFIQYIQTHYYLLMLFHCTCFYFLQTWCIPGTFFFNLLGGALFGIKVGFLLCVLMNTLGAITCYFISKGFLSDIVHNKLKDKFNSISNMIGEHKDNLFFYLTFLRIFPGSPNWIMNITFAHIDNIKWYQVFFSVFFGLMPWNYITCQGGQLLAHIKSKSDIIKTETYVQLALIASAFLIPPLIKKLMTKNSKSEEKTKIH